MALNVHDLRITFNGTDITTTPGETVIGKKNFATVSLVGDGFPQGAPTFSNLDWLSSDIWAMVKDFTPSVNIGMAESLQPEDWDGSYLESYFVYGGDRSYHVNADIQIGNQAYSVDASGHVDALEPTLELHSYQGPPNFPSPFFGDLTSMTPKVDIHEYGILPGGRGLGLGIDAAGEGNDPGIQIWGSMRAPVGYSGQIGFIQLISSSESWYSVVGGNDADSTGGFVLDVPPQGGIFYNGTDVVNGGAIGQTPMDDSPISPISPGQMTVFTREDSFKTYLMYRPDGPDAIWVTVGLLTWSWGGTVTREAVGDNWTVSDSHAVANPGQASNELPVWTSNYNQEMND